MQKLREYFQNWNFEQNDLDKILNSFKLQKIKKNDYFLEKGKVCTSLIFIETGMFQYFTLIDGEIKTTNILTENNFLTSYLSFISEDASHENIIALTDGNIALLNKMCLKRLGDEIPRFKDFYIGLLENLICHIDTSRNDLITLTAEQRYKKIMNENPNLLRKIPLQYLANIIGITPRHLSRIRNNYR